MINCIYKKISMEWNDKIKNKLSKLDGKYSDSGQDLSSYLDGLLYSNPLYYWDYISLDTLLSLQQPKTDFPDEQIFIIYHQITELYFKLSLHEIEQISNNGKNISNDGKDLGWNKKLRVDFFIDRLNRINNYFEALIKSFGIMVNGMEKEQFLKFRMSLLPASGFQSAQYRLIEICTTDINNLVQKDKRNSLDWHQDSSYFKRTEDLNDCCVIWIPIQKIDDKIGPLNLIPSSHLFGGLPFNRIQKNL